MYNSNTILGNTSTDLITSKFASASQQNKCQEMYSLISDELFYEPAQFGKALAMICLSMSIIVGNLLVILAVIVSNRLRTVTNFFIASLAVSDFVIGVGVLPFSFTQDLLGFWTFGHLWCRIWLALDVWVSTASIYNLVVIALDRYVAVTRPLSYRSLVTPKKATAAVCGAWLWSFLVSFPPMVTFQSNAKAQTNQEEDEEFIDCQCTALDNSAYYIFFSASSSFYLPFVALLYIYVKIYTKIRRATAAVDKGYMTLKKRQLPDTSVSNQDDNYSGVANNNNNDTRRFSLIPSSRQSWKTRLTKNVSPQKKCIINITQPQQQQQQQQEAGKNGLSTSLETIALRVHRGRYNAAGATSNGQAACEKKAPIDRSADRLSDRSTDRSTDRSADRSTNRRLSNQKNHLLQIREQNTSQDFEDDELELEDAKNGDKRMAEYVRKMSKTRNVTDYKSVVDKKIDRSIDCSDRSADQSIKPKGRLISNVRFLSKREDSSSKFDILRRPSGVLASTGSVNNESVGSPRHKVRQRLHERYDKKLKREVRAAKTVALVTGCFFLCWSGFCVVYTMKALPFCQLEETPSNVGDQAANGEESSCVPSWAFALVLWLGYTNSALNPLIYAVCNRQFRMAFKRILCCFCFRNPRRGGGSGGMGLSKKDSRFGKNCIFGNKKRVNGEKLVKRQSEITQQKEVLNSSTRLCAAGQNNQCSSVSDDAAGV